MRYENGIQIIDNARVAVAEETLAAAKTLTISDYTIQWLDPGGSNRDITLPAEASSGNMKFIILNTSDGEEENLVIKNDAPATITTLGPGMTGILVCNGTNWKVENDLGIYYDRIDKKAFFGSTSPLYAVSGGVSDVAYFQNGDVIIERDDSAAPQIKFKSGANATNHVALIAFKDETTIGDDVTVQQYVISTKNKSHVTNPSSFMISEQRIDASWHDVFEIEKDLDSGAMLLDATGLALTKSGVSGAQLSMFSNAVYNSGTLLFQDTGDNEKWLFSARASDHASEARQFKITEHYQSSAWYDPFTIMPQTPNDTLVLGPAGVKIGADLIIDGAQYVKKTDSGAADYNPSALTSDYIITVDTTSAARAVVISAEDRNSGSASLPRIFIIKDIAGNANTNNITVSLETSGNIDGAGTFVINANYNTITLIVDGTNGYII